MAKLLSSPRFEYVGVDDLSPMHFEVLQEDDARVSSFKFCVGVRNE